MTYMHRETYKNRHIDQKLVPEGYVAIDEWIAPTIEVLNQKGYTTTFCCAGQPHDDTLILTEDGYGESRFAVWASYISFVDGTRLPSLPNGFTLDEAFMEKFDRTVIRREYSMTDEFKNLF